MTSPVPPQPPAAPRKPLSMAWVLAAIGCFVVIHTFVNVVYRKPGPAHEPAAEARERRRLFVRAELNGWTHYAAHLAPVTSGVGAAQNPAAVATKAAPANILEVVSFDLAGRPGRDPVLHPGPAKIETPAVLPGDGVMRVTMHFDTARSTKALGLALAYSKENHVYFFLQDETRTAPEEPPLPVAPRIELSLPSRVLTGGDWQATLYTRDTIFTWGFSVPPELAAAPAPLPTP